MIKNKETDLLSKNKLLNLALKYLSRQPRSIHEMREYLTNKSFNQTLISEAIEILLEKKYLDDLVFAKNFVENKINHKPKSKFALAYELKKKGVEPAVIEDVLKEYNDHDLAFKALGTKILLWKHLDHENFKKKILNFLQYRGFSYDIILSLLNRLNQPEREN